jgi:hypothetical protein
MCQEVVCNIEHLMLTRVGVIGVFVPIQEGRRTWNTSQLAARHLGRAASRVRSLRVKMSRPLLIAHHGGVRSP